MRSKVRFEGNDRGWVRVHLTPELLASYQSLGRRRHRERLAAGAVDIRSLEEDSPEGLHEQGAVAEGAFHEWQPHLHWNAYLEGAEFEAFKVGKGPDFEPDIGIQSCLPGGNLVIPPKEPIDHRYVLVWVRYDQSSGVALPGVLLRGWLHGTEVMQDRYWRPDLPTPAFLVSFWELRSMLSLDVL